MQTGETLAVKIYRKIELNNWMIKMIAQEIDLLRKLDHPNIVKVHNVIEDADRIYMIIDDIKGSNLFNHII